MLELVGSGRERVSSDTSKHVLIVEDDEEIGALIKRHLLDNDIQSTVVLNGEDMDQVLDTSHIDLVILDLMLPGEDGISICRRLRSAGAIPIIIVSARGDDFDRVIGLEVGADDYLPKPFNPRELIARVRAMLRRMELGAGVFKPVQSNLEFEGWKIDARRRVLKNPDGAVVALTPGEFDLLQVLCERHGRVLSREQLIDLTQGKVGVLNGRNIDILVSRVRSKLEAAGAEYAFIRTVRSGGYEFVARTVASA